MKSTLVYSTVFPGIEPYLEDWYDSILRQSASDFTLCIGQDELGRDSVCKAAGRTVDASWILAPRGSTIAEVRNAGLGEVASQEGFVVTVDSDDILLPDRVQHARAALADADVVACAIELAAEDGSPTGDVVTLPKSVQATEILPRCNIFGLSNSAWRTEMLRSCLPVPREALLVDWYLVTQAWLSGAVLRFDPRVGMLYRQYDRSSAQIRPPFTAQQVCRDTDKVCRHFELVKDGFRRGQDRVRQGELVAVAEDVTRFRDVICEDADALEDYLQRLNKSDCGRVWWESIAFQGLRSLWS